MSARERKTPWFGIAVDAVPVLDVDPDGGAVGELHVVLSPTGAPARHADRLVRVVLSRPMLEILARMAHDTGAVEAVIEHPTGVVFTDEEAAEYAAARVADRANYLRTQHGLAERPRRVDDGQGEVDAATYRAVLDG